MTFDLTSGIVQILTANDVNAGTGFVLSSKGLIATCAHVVRDAGAGPESKITVRFQQNGKKYSALVIKEWWRSPDNEDVAILKLEHEIPEDVRALADARIEDARKPEAEPARTPELTFETFAEGPSNFHAYTVAQMIGAGVGVTFPVWLLHSPPG